MYDLPRELPNDLGTRVLGNQEISGNSQNFIELLSSAQYSFRDENFVSTSKDIVENRN